MTDDKKPVRCPACDWTGPRSACNRGGATDTDEHRCPACGALIDLPAEETPDHDEQ